MIKIYRVNWSKNVTDKALSRIFSQKLYMYNFWENILDKALKLVSYNDVNMNFIFYWNFLFYWHSFDQSLQFLYRDLKKVFIPIKWVKILCTAAIGLNISSWKAGGLWRHEFAIIYEYKLTIHLHVIWLFCDVTAYYSCADIS